VQSFSSSNFVLFFIKLSLENLTDDKHCYKFYSVTNCFLEVDKIDHGLNVVRNLRSCKWSKLIKDNSCKLDHAKTGSLLQRKCITCLQGRANVPLLFSAHSLFQICINRPKTFHC